MIHRNLRHAATIFIGALLTSSAQGANYFLKPISATGPHSINGNQIVLEGGGQVVTFEIRLDDWTQVPDVGSCGNGTVCSVIAQDCPAGPCVQHVGLINTYQATIDGDGFEGILSPVLLGPTELIDTNNPEFVFFGLGAALAAVNTSTDSYAYGGVLLNGAASPPYGGVDKYGGRLDVNVPIDATGTFTIGFRLTPLDTFMGDPNGTPILPITTTAALLSIACQSGADCDDANACTTDVCNADNTCSNDDNFDAAVFCCNPVNGSLATIDDGNDCTDDVCNPSGAVDHPLLPVGSACGDPGNTECDDPDTCNSAGLCLENLAPIGFACGDPADSQCNGADTCNGVGQCQTNIAASGSPCGDPANTGCTDPDTCDGIGGCLANDAPNGLSCDDGAFCNVGELCIDGVCAGGLPESCDDGLTCTIDSCDEAGDVCNNDLTAGNCLIAGVCVTDGEFNPENDCEACNVAVTTTDWTLRPEGSVCDDGNACTGTGAPGVGDDTCDAIGVCSGQVDPNCNDACIDAVEVFAGINTGNNTTASPIDDAEASCQPNANNDVWFVYHATCDGQLLLTTTGTVLVPENDPVLNVYNACGGFEIACNDDGGPGLQAAVTFSTTALTPYFIRIAGFQQNVGDIVLNVIPLGDCVIDGICHENGTVNPANECEVCVAEVSNSSWTPRTKGTVCGNPAGTECDSPDACNGNGICETNFKPDGVACSDDGNACRFDVCQQGACTHPPVPPGAACGDPADSVCDHPDTCDGVGECVENFELLGVACGDQSSDQCDNPNICDGSGLCDDNLAPLGTPCDDAEVCTGTDVCDQGTCAGVGIAQAPLVEGLASRHLAVTPLPAGSPGPVALRLTSPDFPCLLKYIALDGSTTTTPVFQLIDDWGTITVADDVIVPGTVYAVQAECGGFNSGIGVGSTALWGDLDGDGTVTLADVQRTVFGFQGDFSQNTAEELDIWGCIPDGVINFDDILHTVLAFQGVTYADSGCPLPCP